jgi:hypothetical protein
MFAVLGRLKALLTPDNVSALDAILGVITDPASRTYSIFWQELGAKHAFTEPQKGGAYQALKTLHGIVRDYRG